MEKPEFDNTIDFFEDEVDCAIMSDPKFEEALADMATAPATAAEEVRDEDEDLVDTSMDYDGSIPKADIVDMDADDVLAAERDIAHDPFEDDELIDVKTTDKDNMIFIVTKNAMCIEFKETDVRCTSRNSIGVKGINLDEGDEVVGMQIDTQGESLLLVTENGIGKRTSLDKFRVQKRGGKGLRCYKLNDKTGHVVGVKAVNDNHEIMMITNEGIIIQIRMSDLRELGRVTSGVKLMDLAENVKIAKIAKVRDEISEDEAVINSDKVNDNDFDETDSEVSDED